MNGDVIIILLLSKYFSFRQVLVQEKRARGASKGYGRQSRPRLGLVSSKEDHFRATSLQSLESRFILDWLLFFVKYWSIVLKITGLTDLVFKLYCYQVTTVKPLFYIFSWGWTQKFFLWLRLDRNATHLRTVHGDHATKFSQHMLNMDSNHSIHTCVRWWRLVWRRGCERCRFLSRKSQALQKILPTKV